MCLKSVQNIIAHKMTSTTLAVSYLSNEATTVAVKITPAAIGDGVRRPFHLALLIDVSGSMEGDRINSVKQTLTLLLDMLDDDDTLTIITYSHTAHMIANSVKLEHQRDMLRTSIMDLNAGGGTNMESAILLLHDTQTIVDSVFILTDGHVNSGMTSAGQLRRYALNAVRTGTPINTLGYGENHNSRLLRDIANCSRGSYTFADTNEILPAIVGNISAGLATEVGRNAILQFPIGWRSLEFSVRESDPCCYFVGTLIAEKPQYVVLEKVLEHAADPPVFTLQWTDAAGRLETASVTATVEGDQSFTAEDVSEQVYRARAAHLLARVTDICERYEYEEARTVLAGFATELAAADCATRPLIAQLQAQMEDMRDSLPVGPAPGTPSYTMRNNMPDHIPMAPLLCRMASNTNALGVQAGFLSSTASARRTTAPLDATFSSPVQRTTAHTITQRFTQTPAYDEDESSVSLPELQAAFTAAIAAAAGGAGAVAGASNSTVASPSPRGASPTYEETVD